jgi:hypothetical protein
MESVIAEALHLCNQKCLEIYTVLNSYSWRCAKERPGVLFKIGNGVNRESANYARLSYTGHADMEGYSFWIRETRFSSVKQVKVIPLFSISERLEKLVLSQSKPRDAGVFKATKSGLVNKERIRVPHR